MAVDHRMRGGRSADLTEAGASERQSLQKALGQMKLNHIYHSVDGRAWDLFVSRVLARLLSACRAGSQKDLGGKLPSLAALLRDRQPLPRDAPGSQCSAASGHLAIQIWAPESTDGH